MLKNKHSEYKLAKKKKIPAPLLGVLIGISAFAALSGTDYAVSYYQGENYMPYSEVVQFCDELDVNMSYFTYETSPKKQNTRAVFPKDGIKLNIFMKNLTEEQKNDMQERYRLENERYWNLYKVHKEDEKNYDCIIDTTNLSVEEVANEIIKKYEEWLNKQNF